jgi:lipopolysaccharide transport system permease protein
MTSGALASWARDCGAAVALSWRIFQRTIGAKYRKSFLGYFWMVAPALLITGGVTLASQAGVLSPGPTPLPAPLSVFLGTLLWQIFAEAIDVPHQAFEGARSYLTRVHFPREAIVLAQLYESLLTTAVRLVLALVLVALAHGFDFGGFLLAGTCFYGAVLLGLGIGALLMPFTQLFADLHQTLKLLLGYGLFLTPAMYQPEENSWFATIVRWNPVSPLMNAAREAAAGQALAQPVTLLLVLGGGVLATAAGLLLVRAVAPIVIERMLLGGR